MILSASRMGFLLSLLSYDQLDGRASEAKGITQAVFQIALVGEVEQLCIVAEDHKGGGCRTDLRHIVDLQVSALIRGGLHAGGRIVLFSINVVSLFLLYLFATKSIGRHSNACRCPTMKLC